MIYHRHWTRFLHLVRRRRQNRCRRRRRRRCRHVVAVVVAMVIVVADVVIGVVVVEKRYSRDKLKQNDSWKMITLTNTRILWDLEFEIIFLFALASAELLRKTYITNEPLWFVLLTTTTLGTLSSTYLQAAPCFDQFSLPPVFHYFRTNQPSWLHFFWTWRSNGIWCVKVFKT